MKGDAVKERGIFVLVDENREETLHKNVLLKAQDKVACEEKGSSAESGRPFFVFAAEGAVAGKNWRKIPILNLVI